MLRFLFILFPILAPGISALAQTTIYGTIRNAKARQPVSSANVMLQTPDRRTMFGYAITKDDGAYSISYNGKIDTLLIAVTGFNIKEQTKIIFSNNQRIDFDVEESNLNIREVVVKSPAVTRQSDTLTYHVAKYADVTDHSIGDVLKKMPGIEVARSGEIKYNGKPINKFYVEDMDMLGGRYGIATNNIRAKDIASVQVYENHQPIRAIKDLISSESGAINLRLKDDAKGTWNSITQLGAGYKPGMWNAEATAIFFGRKFQTIDTYKTNNSGDDVANELRSFYDVIDETSTLLGVQNPTEPELDEARYLDNNIHTVSLNSITKLNKELEMTTNAHYIHDFQTSRGTSVTTHYLPNQAPFIVDEQTYATGRTDQTEVNLQLRSNTDKNYFQEKVTFAGRWDRDFGKVINDQQNVAQRFKLPRIAFRNIFSTYRRMGKTTINFNSTTDYNSKPTSLRIRPMIYPEVFDSPADYPNAQQTLDSRRFTTRNSAFTAYRVRKWSFTLNAALNAQIEWMSSSLTPMNDRMQTLPVVDTMQNDIYWRKLDVIFGPTIGYRDGEKVNIRLYVPLDFMSLYANDKITQQKTRTNKLLVTPSLSVESTLTYNLKFSARAMYNEIYGGLYDTYRGYIMTSYRMIASKQGDVSRNKMQNYSASFSYANAIRALFGSVDISYFRSRRNLMYGTTYEGSLSRIEAVAHPNTLSGYRFTANISKRIDGISTTFNLSGGFSRSWNKVLRQGVLIPTSYDIASAGLGFITRFTQAVRLEYKADYTRSQSRINGKELLSPIDVLRQDAALNLIIKQKFICRLGVEHYYNGSVGGGDRNMLFLDASISYKTKKMEYSIEGRNLMDTGIFRSASYSDITNYVYSYKLRPVSVMFKIKFSLR